MLSSRLWSAARRRAGMRLVLLGGLSLCLLSGAPSCALYGFDDDGGFALPIAATQSFTLQVDMEALMGGGGATAPADRTWVIPLAATPIDMASASKDLAANRDKLERLEIKRIEVRPFDNSLTTDLPPIQLAVGEYMGGGNDTIMFATIPSIPAGSTESQLAAIDKAGTDGAQPLLTSLRFDFVPAAVLDIRRGQLIPTGRTELEITLTIQATIDPTK